MKIRTLARIVTFAALFSWFCAGLLGLHGHIHLDGSPATLDSSFFKDALDDSYGHKANPHVDADSNSAPAKNLQFAILLIAGFVILLHSLQGRPRVNLPDSYVFPSAICGLRPPLRAPPPLPLA